MSRRRYSDNSEESEKAVERYLCTQVRAAGGISLKFSSGTQTGYPDRILVFPDGSVVWVELKSKGANPTKLQSHRMMVLRGLRQEVRLCDSKSKVNEIISAHRRSGRSRQREEGEA